MLLSFDRLIFTLFCNFRPFQGTEKEAHGAWAPFSASMLFQGCCLYGDAECILQRIDIDCFLNIGNLILLNRADGGEEIAYLQQTGTEIIIRSLIIGRNNERTNFGLGLNVVSSAGLPFSE